MGCFLCASKSSSPTTADTQSNKLKKGNSQRRKPDAHHERTPTLSDASKVSAPNSVKEESKVVSPSVGSRESNATGSPRPSGNPARCKARKFAFSELVAATGNFKKEFLLGAGGFGPVYKGYLKPSGEKVAIKRLDSNGNQGIREFVVEVLTLCNADHANLVKLIGYCAEEEQRLLVYEYMPLGSLENHLHGNRTRRRSLNWNTRMNIAACAAKGLDYLHNRMKPPVIYRDLKCSNILLGEEYLPKLSDFGLAKVGPSGDESHVSTRVMGTYGYCAPEYAMTGQLTFKSDIYSFGVVLLEIVTGRRAFDIQEPGPAKNIVEWARPMFKDRRKFHQMADPALGGNYPSRGLYQVLAIAAMCTEKDPDLRPDITEIVKALTYLSSQTYDPIRNTLIALNGTEQNASSPNSEG